MKGAVIGIITGVLGLLLLFPLSIIQLQDGTVDIHLLDSYYVITYPIALLYLAVILGGFFSLGGLMESRFRDRRFWLSLLLCLVVGVMLFWVRK